jgi:hypothetical protein
MYGGYNGTHPDNDPYGPHQEDDLNWHQKAGYQGMMPLGGYDDPYAGNPMGAGFPIWSGRSALSGSGRVKRVITGHKSCFRPN